jgi:hypothetical protein
MQHAGSGTARDAGGPARAQEGPVAEDEWRQESRGATARGDGTSLVHLLLTQVARGLGRSSRTPTRQNLRRDFEEQPRRHPHRTHGSKLLDLLGQRPQAHVARVGLDQRNVAQALPGFSRGSLRQGVDEGHDASRGIVGDAGADLRGGGLLSPVAG